MKNQERKFDLINLLKYAMVLVLAAYVAVLMVQAGGTKTPMKTVSANIREVMSTQGMRKGTTQDLKRYYGLNAEDYAGVTLYLPDGVMDVGELLVIKLQDISQAEYVEEAARKRLDAQKQNFEGYGAQQTKLINAAVVESRGDYVFMVVSEDAEAVQTAFRKSL